MTAQDDQQAMLGLAGKDADWLPPAFDATGRPGAVFPARGVRPETSDMSGGEKEDGADVA